MNIHVANQRKLALFTFTPTLDTNAYAAGDVVFAPVAIALGRYLRGIVKYVRVVDKADQASAATTFYFMNSEKALGPVNDAPAIADGNVPEIFGTIAVTTSIDVGGAKIGHSTESYVPFQLTGGVASLWVSATGAGTPTYAADSLVVTVAIELEAGE